MLAGNSFTTAKKNDYVASVAYKTNNTRPPNALGNHKLLANSSFIIANFERDITGWMQLIGSWLEIIRLILLKPARSRYITEVLLLLLIFPSCLTI